MKQMTSEQVLHRLAVWCSRAERCAYDLRRKMDAWKVPLEEQDKIIQHLQQEKFWDESRYCCAFVNDKSRYNQWGIQKIRYELKKKQIPDSFIQEALENIDPEESKEQLRRLIQNKRKTVKGKNEFEIKQKLMRFATGKGFSLSEIEKILQ
jgi:regulatory protein